jgi:hypothetical protein
MLRKRLQMHQEGRMGIKDLGGRRLLYLRKPMEWTWGNCGSLKQLVSARMRMTHCAKVAQCKEHRLQRQGKDSIAPRTLKGRTSRKKHWKGPECKTRIKNPGTRQKLHLQIKRTSEEFNRKAFGLEFMKQATRMSSGLWVMRNWTLSRGWPPPKQKIKDWAFWSGRPPPKQKETY